MKKRFVLLSAILAVFVFFLTAAPASKTRAVAAEISAQSEDFFTAERMKETVGAFVGSGTDNRIDRTSFTAAEKRAGDWLEEQVRTLDDARFTVMRSTVDYSEQYQSTNLEVRFKGDESAKQVILGANYDNLFGNIGNMKGVGGAGALQNATGVAVLLEMLRYFDEVNPRYPFDVAVVFFGASEVGWIGSKAYLNAMSATERANTLLMCNIERIGGDNLYVYDDEVRTLHGDFMLSTASENGLPFMRTPKFTPYIDSKTVSSIPYTTWGMVGDNAPFMESGIPTVHIFGGRLGSLDLGPAETLGKRISYTKNDTLEGLSSAYPSYGAQMTYVATLLRHTLARDGFADVCMVSLDEKYDYTWLTKPIYVSLILIGVLVVMGVVIIFLVKHFEKKYPYVPPQKRLKIAVFGMEYETPTEEDIFVDIAPRPRNPFDGY